MNGETILIVDDEPSIIELLEYNLAKEGYGVLTARDGAAALNIFKAGGVSIVLLDVMMPELDGFAVCREIRKQSDVPIIMITAKSGETNKIVGLELGADDYVTKPFSIGELIARVRAVLRRSVKQTTASDAGDIITIGPLVIDRIRREVRAAGAKVELTTKEFDLLCLLAMNPGVVLTRDRILDLVWGSESAVVDRTVDVHVRHIREKLECIPGVTKFISTVRGIGYRFES